MLSFELVFSLSSTLCGNYYSVKSAAASAESCPPVVAIAAYCFHMLLFLFMETELVKVTHLSVIVKSVMFTPITFTSMVCSTSTFVICEWYC